jgi:hypothetical protein
LPGITVVTPCLKQTSLLIFLFLGLASLPAFSQTCETATSIPSGLKKLGAGSSTVDYESNTAVKGGQSVYVKIKNENVLGVSYILTIREDAKPGRTNCSYKAILPPRTSVILYGAVFANPPIAWKVTVAIGSESSAGVLTYEVYSATK